MKKILFVQQTLEPLGGGQAVAAWMIEALKQDNAVSLLTWTPPRLEAVNRFYGTSLRDSELTILSPHPLLRRFIDLDPDPGSFQKLSYLMRWCRKLASQHDVLLSAENEIDFGRQGIQYVHYPYLHQKVSPFLDAPWPQKLWRGVRGQYRPWMLLSGFSYRRLRENVTLVNSNWTGARVKAVYGIEPITVYPPVPGQFPDTPWQERENGFVCIGRFAPGKRFRRIIDILSAVRSRGHDVRLHIIGIPDPIWGNEYYPRVVRKVAKNSAWVLLHENLSRPELAELVAGVRYGIHGMVDEHFGIAVAEMVKAGCIPFVPPDGGPREIIGDQERLIYTSQAEAVQKILRVLGSAHEQASLRAHLESRKGLFSTETFVRRIREIVDQFASGRL